MTYNEWRDELKSNLLCVSDGERRRVLDYYAEAYADRREAGFSEREIIDDFGAPYDAAQRILKDGDGDISSPPPPDEQSEREETERKKETWRERREREREEREEKRKQSEYERDRAREQDYGRAEFRNNDYRKEDYRSDDYRQHSAPPEKPKKKDDYTWVFVLLCIIFCVPIFGVIISLVGITIALCTAPFAVFITGIAQIGGAVGMFVGGQVFNGVIALGEGIIAVGVGVLLFAVFAKIIKFIWWLFKKLFSWIKSLFSGKEKEA